MLPVESSAGPSHRALQRLRAAGQSLWLDTITRELLTSGRLQRYIDDLAITGLTSNPAIFDHALKTSTAYDAAIAEGLRDGKSAEQVFIEIALEDISRAADIFRPIHARSSGVDGWVSLEVSPLLARDAQSTLAAATDLHRRAGRPNVLIKIPGTPEGLPAVEDAIYAGIPVNVTLLFSPDQYLAAAEAYLRGVERRISAGLNPNVGSVASLFISRWDAAIAGRVPPALTNTLGIAMGARTYRAYTALLASPRWLRAFNAGARPQRLLFASTGTKDPHASATLYAGALAAPLTIDTLPEATLHALAAQDDAGPPAALATGAPEAVLTELQKAGIDVDRLAAKLQDDGAAAFVASWTELLAVIASK
jgi:transaldolase